MLGLVTDSVPIAGDPQGALQPPANSGRLLRSTWGSAHAAYSRFQTGTRPVAQRRRIANPSPSFSSFRLVNQRVQT